MRKQEEVSLPHIKKAAILKIAAFMAFRLNHDIAPRGRNASRYNYIITQEGKELVKKKGQYLPL